MGIDSQNTKTDWEPQPSPSDIPPDIEPQAFRSKSRGIQSEAISHDKMHWQSQKSGGESSGILPSTPGNVRYAAGRIKNEEGVVTLRNYI